MLNYFDNLLYHVHCVSASSLGDGHFNDVIVVASIAQVAAIHFTSKPLGNQHTVQDALHTLVAKRRFRCLGELVIKRAHCSVGESQNFICNSTDSDRLAGQWHIKLSFDYVELRSQVAFVHLRTFQVNLASSFDFPPTFLAFWDRQYIFKIGKSRAIQMLKHVCNRY